MKKPLILTFLLLVPLLISCNTDKKPVSSEPSYITTPSISQHNDKTNLDSPVGSSTPDSASKPQASMTKYDRPTFYYVNLLIEKYVNLRYDMEYKGDINTLKSYIDEKSTIYQSELQYFLNLKSSGITTKLKKYYADDYVYTPSSQFVVYVSIRFKQTGPNDDTVDKEIKQIYTVDVDEPISGPDYLKGFRISAIANIE